MTDTASRPLVAIVDGYSTGNFLPTAFNTRGADVVHVQSTPEWLTSMLLPDLSHYVGNIVHTSIEKTVAELSARGVIAVVAGQEPGVPLTDELSTALGVASNGTTHSKAKRDKFAMTETVRAAGIRCAAQHVATTADALAEWAGALGTTPVVVKPLSSASTDGVHICDDVDAVRTAAQSVLSTRDIFDLPNRHVLGQSYLDGDEYIVDTVSAQGRRFVVGVWRYQKNLVNGKNIYDRDVLMPADEDPVPELIAYTDRVLDTFGIDWGPTHTELKMTSNGPALVEIGARSNGNMNPGFHDVCLGHNQADLIALAHLDPGRFVDEYGDSVYHMRQPAVVYNAPSTRSGVITAIDEATVKEIEQLETVHLLSVKLAPGKELKQTIDLLTSPLRVFLTGPREEAIDADYHRVRALKDKVYRI